MPPASQRPLLNRLLALEPLVVSTLRHGFVTFTSIDAAMVEMGGKVSAADIAVALETAGLEVPIRTLYRWKAEVDREAA